MTYDNTNSGTLSKNDRREKDTHPQYKGQINVDGVDYWLSAWVRTRKSDGGKFFSLSVKPKGARQAKAPSKPASPDWDTGDEIPF